MIDEEVKRLIDEGYQTAQKVIRENIDDLHTIAKALLEYETLTRTRGFRQRMPLLQNTGLRQDLKR
jgi:ATP-dependent Zn protease